MFMSLIGMVLWIINCMMIQTLAYNFMLQIYKLLLVNFMRHLKYTLIFAALVSSYRSVNG